MREEIRIQKIEGDEPLQACEHCNPKAEDIQIGCRLAASDGDEMRGLAVYVLYLPAGPMALCERGLCEQLNLWLNE